MPAKIFIPTKIVKADFYLDDIKRVISLKYHPNRAGVQIVIEPLTCMIGDSGLADLERFIAQARKELKKLGMTG